VQELLYVLIAPLLVAGATLACRRWGSGIGGLISAFPAVVGPVLLLVAQERGAAVTARAANATLLGLVALSAFVVAYSQAARRSAWGASLTAGWSSAAILAVLVGLLGRGLAFPAGLIVAATSLGAAYRLTPAARHAPVPLGAPARSGIALRMSATVVLIVTLAAAVRGFGPVIGGALAGLPVLASVLVVFTHRAHGAHAAVELMRGMLVGMAGFVGFCAAVAALVVPAGVPVAFATATLVAVALQALCALLASVGGSRTWQITHAVRG
jgi:hypothetical protein